MSFKLHSRVAPLLLFKLMNQFMYQRMDGTKAQSTQDQHSFNLHLCASVFQHDVGQYLLTGISGQQLLASYH